VPLPFRDLDDTFCAFRISFARPIFFPLHLLFLDFLGIFIVPLIKKIRGAPFTDPTLYTDYDFNPTLLPVRQGPVDFNIFRILNFCIGIYFPASYTGFRQL